MSAPRLTVPLVLEVAEKQADGIGGHSTQWVARGTLWAAMAASAGREAKGEVGAVSVVTWKITTRAVAAGDPRRPAPGDRLRLGTRLFRVEAVAEQDASGRWLICYAKEEGAP